MLDILKRYNFWDKPVSGCGILRESYLEKLSLFMNVRSKEIDFRAQLGDKKVYIQMAYTIGDDESALFKRDFRLLS